MAGYFECLDYEQKAIFGEVSYQFDEQWQLTVGGRYFDYDRVDTSTFRTEAAFGGSALNSEEDLGETGDNFKANLSYTPNEDTLIYLQWSEGFRLGQGQSAPPPSCDTDNNGKLDFTEGDITNRVEADTTENFELGGKFTLLDNRLTLNTALFRIDWSNLPVSITNTNSTTTGGTCPGATSDCK